MNNTSPEQTANTLKVYVSSTSFVEVVNVLPLGSLLNPFTNTQQTKQQNHSMPTLRNHDTMPRGKACFAHSLTMNQYGWSSNINYLGSRTSRSIVTRLTQSINKNQFSNSWCSGPYRTAPVSPFSAGVLLSL